ncbi:hypothetical protein WICPIJ_002954 [Wickerhamomyces pijperi]|uniref:Cyclin N-terminal domain-containing protein n=1 Tax=Wickerhamomyces pijperi TaxID=599730 RepID=A0A9P8TPC7_WICPI|nr:hypothetical protein WICPIJ_002954 [Wickerhamomyces pijperi]
MSLKRAQPIVPSQDENSIITASKNVLAKGTLTSSTNAAVVQPSQQKRPALSNLTNTSSQHVQTALAESKSEPPAEGNERKALKRPNTIDEEEEEQSEATGATEEPSRKKVKIAAEWKDLDSADSDDPLMVSEYVNDIFDYLHVSETKNLPDPTYLTWQEHMKPRMRAILVDWLVEVHLRFRLLPESLFLAINIMDRVISKVVVEVDKLQLLATGSLFIAAKYEEVYSPSVKNYAYVTDGGYTEQQILDTERFILQMLEFDLSYPNPMNFLRRISKADDYDLETRTVGKYFLEITTIENDFIGLKPSECAAAAMYLSRKMLGRHEWDSTLVHYSGGYTKEMLAGTVEKLMKYLSGTVVHEEFFKKYASKKYMKSSILARQWAKRMVE